MKVSLLNKIFKTQASYSLDVFLVEDIYHKDTSKLLKKLEMDAVCILEISDLTNVNN